MLKQVADTTREVADRLKHDVTFVAGKKSAEVVGSSVPAALGVSNLASVSTLGLVAAVSAGLTQMEYHKKLQAIQELYTDEASAQLGKTRDGIKKDDLKILAAGDENKKIAANSTIGEALRKAKRQRNVGLGLSIAASLIAFSVAGFLFAAGGPIAAVGVVGFIAKALTSLAVYNIAKAPMQFAANKIFDLNKETTHDRIAAIAKDRESGRVITQEQVLGVYVSANPDIAAMIATRYGKSYDELEVADKQQITDALGKLLHVDQITNDINKGRVNVGELAFAAEGKSSGVMPRNPELEKRSIVSQVVGKLKDMTSRIKKTALTGATPSPVPPLDQVAVQFNNPAPAVGFVERLGRAPRRDGLSHVEQLAQARPDTTIATQR